MKVPRAPSPRPAIMHTKYATADSREPQPPLPPPPDPTVNNERRKRKRLNIPGRLPSRRARMHANTSATGSREPPAHVLSALYLFRKKGTAEAQKKMRPARSLSRPAGMYIKRSTIKVESRIYPFPHPHPVHENRMAKGGKKNASRTLAFPTL